MFWEDKVAEQEFYKKIYRTEPFKMIVGDDFHFIAIEHYVKRMILSATEQILSPNFDEILRSACLREIGKACAQMFLKHSGIDTKTDLDTFISNINTISLGHRSFKRSGDVIYEDTYCHGQCWCPIINNLDTQPDCLICSTCSKSARETLFQTVLKQPVKADIVDSALLSGTDTCILSIQLSPP